MCYLAVMHLDSFFKHWVMSSRFFMSLILGLPGQLLWTVAQLGSGQFLRERLQHIAVMQSSLGTVCCLKRAVKKQLAQGEACPDVQGSKWWFFFKFHIDKAQHRMTQNDARTTTGFEGAHLPISCLLERCCQGGKEREGEQWCLWSSLFESHSTAGPKASG